MYREGALLPLVPFACWKSIPSKWLFEESCYKILLYRSRMAATLLESRVCFAISRWKWGTPSYDAALSFINGTDGILGFLWTVPLSYFRLLPWLEPVVHSFIWFGFETNKQKNPNGSPPFLISSTYFPPANTFSYTLQLQNSCVQALPTSLPEAISL